MRASDYCNFSHNLSSLIGSVNATKLVAILPQVQRIEDEKTAKKIDFIF
ncbi:hypothetical protein ATORI0001_0455 [Lancefieldella rimae ATCC 49626]|uniref:Uncharacterized protein n=1 Tax=Lancefieldella rimae (strain ATCC 49626 / DSM 7090 / CCUG 31168 / NBRC 15546 / VPI D140H-11A) TaxID=553184 RepID=B9CKB0_LANR4|nr:hypothetical protein ATORI0001_0455 [Lancefieldella rimae ATCC 49626]